KPAEALQAYDRMTATGASGASMADMGRADVALYEGRYADAQHILETSIAVDAKRGNASAMAAKYVALAESHEGLGHKPAAVAAARKAIDAGSDLRLQALAAMVLIRQGEAKQAKPIAEKLSQQLTRQPRAYGRILDAQIALKEKRTADAVDAFVAS